MLLITIHKHHLDLNVDILKGEMIWKSCVKFVFTYNTALLTFNVTVDQLL